MLAARSSSGDALGVAVIAALWTRVASAAALCIALGCAPRAAGWQPAGEVEAASGSAAGLAHRLAGYEAHFAIAWSGAQVGVAVERVQSLPADVGSPEDDAGVRFIRRERVVVRRGDAVIASETQIVIDVDVDLRARRVELAQRVAGTSRRGVAERDERGDWRVVLGDEPPRVVDGEAQPIELVALRYGLDPASVRDGPALLAGYGFAIGELVLTEVGGDEAGGARAVRAVLVTEGGRLGARFEFNRAGTVSRVVADDGAVAARVTAAAATAPFEPPEVVASSSIPVAGAERARDRVTLTIGPVARRPPPPLPGQRVVVRGDAWRVSLAPGDDGGPRVDAAAAARVDGAAAAARVNGAAARADSTTAQARVDSEIARVAAEIGAGVARGRAEIAALTRATADRIAGDLGAGADTARAALTLGRGDCTAHAAAFVALARARGYPAEMVTGYRLDGDRLVRHRWAIAAVDGVWIAVDPTWGEVPARARLLGLTRHGPDAAEIAVTDELAFAGLAGAQATVE